MSDQNLEIPPAGQVKVKIKDGNDEWYVTYDPTSGIGISTTAKPFEFNLSSITNNQTGKKYSRLEDPDRPGSSFAVETGGGLTWSSHRDTPKWTRMFKHGSTTEFKMYIHDNTDQTLTVVNGTLTTKKLADVTTWTEFVF